MSWLDEKTYIYIKNASCFSTSTANFYLPLTGLEDENVSFSAGAVRFIPTNSGKVVSISITTSGAMGSTIFTITDETLGTTIGTKTATLTNADQSYVIDFTTGLDSGTNEYNGDGAISIGVNPTTGGSTIQYSVKFEIDL